MTEQAFTKEQLVETLATEQKYRVVFEKKDGTIRTMYCTRNSTFIPLPPEPPVESLTEGVFFPEPKPPRKENPNVLPVYDLQKESWRSFTVASVKSIEPVDDVPALEEDDVNG